MNYPTRHWRGELGLGQSFGLNVVLGHILLSVIQRGLSAVLSRLRTVARMLVCTLVVRLGVAVWHFVGL